MRPLNLAFFVGEFPKISETFIVNQIVGMIDRGHEVTVYGEPASTTALLHPIVRQYQNRWKIRSRPAIPESRAIRSLGAVGLAVCHGWRNPGLLARSLRFRKYGRCSASLKLLYSAMPFLGNPARHDVVSCHFADYGLLAIALRRMGAIKGKITTTFHGTDISFYLEKAGPAAYLPLFQRGDLFLPVSEYWRGKLMSLGCPKEKVEVHHMGVDRALFPFRDRGADQRHPVRLVSVGRLVEKKGICYSIKAAAQLAKTHPCIHYEIVGDGPLRGELSALIDSLGVRDKIVLTGWKTGEEISRILDDADILVAPSVTATNGDQEGIPVTIMEAMSTGLPVVSTWHSGIPELVRDRVSGLLAPERDVAALTSHLLAIIERPELRRKMGAAGSAIVQANYNIDALNDRLETIFRTFTADNRNEDPTGDEKF